MVPLQQYGFERTSCACVECQQPCQHVSGFLSPLDLEHWWKIGGDGPYTALWVLENFAASPGALVSKDGRRFRIPTIVPKRTWAGGCQFYTAKGLCAIHEDAPYGCAFFDYHMSQAEGTHRSTAVLVAIWEDRLQGGLYSRAWQMLADRCQTVEAPEVVRQRFQARQEVMR